LGGREDLPKKRDSGRRAKKQKRGAGKGGAGTHPCKKHSRRGVGAGGVSAKKKNLYLLWDEGEKVRFPGDDKKRF